MAHHGLPLPPPAAAAPTEWGGGASGVAPPGEQWWSPRALAWTHRAIMGVSLAIFFYECWAYNTIFLRRILPEVGKQNMVMCFRILFNTAWALALWSYHMAHWTDPGVVPDRWRAFVRTTGDLLPIAPAQPRWQPAKATLCKKCSEPRPERAHHCVPCGTCVLRMDHHCPWINNCVGFQNHKFFLQLSMYTWLAAFIGLATALPELWRFTAMAAGVGDEEWNREIVARVEMGNIYAFLLFGLFAFLIVLLLASLMSTHMPLAMRNMTTIEDLYDSPNPYNHGSPMANLAQVFGAWGLDWFLPVRPRVPVSDGVLYPPPMPSHKDGLDGGQDFESLTLVDGEVTTDDQAHGSTVALLHEDGADVERSWRIRYRVRSPADVQSLKEATSSPFMAQFWACGQSGGNRGNGRVGR